ncbi:MAG: efflux RND transporter periplasmic adaptor subunit [Anaerovoracaceae bacterium]|jgi:RND family efflux transporter MFP subunit|nr:efflux RND transporter periplasmic adaptor subunit [Anaerovoracaceae bacterium]
MERAKKTRKITIKKRYLIPLIIVVVAIVLALVLSQFPGLFGVPQGIQVTTGSVEKMDVSSEISIKGTVEGEKSAKLSAMGGYQILDLLVKEGDLVKENQLLAKLKLDSGNISTGQSTLEASRLEYSAAKELYAQGAISRADYLRAKGAYETALSSSANTRITSPFSGTVTRVNGVTGGYTETGLPLIVVEDLSHLKMEVLISEYDIGKVKLDQKVIISSEIIGNQELEGRVRKISPTGEAKDLTGKEMVVPVTISIQKADSKLISGVTAKARIIIEEAKGVLTVPIEAVIEDPESRENFIYTLEENMLKKVKVDLGVEGNFNVEIKKAKLDIGTLVVLSPTLDMEDGTMAYDPRLRSEGSK